MTELRIVIKTKESEVARGVKILNFGRFLKPNRSLVVDGYDGAGAV